NAAFREKTDVIVDALKQGEAVTVALRRSRVFSSRFLSMVAVAEEGGSLVEVLRQQVPVYRDEAERRLKALTATFTFLLWLLYAGFMVIAIFQVARIYLGALGL